jgi:hypothetical protein
VEWSIPQPVIWADPAADQINGWGWGVGDPVTVHLFDPAGALSYSGVREARPDTGVDFDLRAESIDLQAGFRITLEDGSTLKELSVSAVGVTDFDLSAHTISGVYDPTPGLGFLIYLGGVQPDNLAFEGERWTAAFADMAAVVGSEVAQPDEDGDMTGIGFGVPELPPTASP